LHTALKAIVATAAAIVSIAASAAHPVHPPAASEIDVRQARQEQRIERAIARGDLSRRELRSLRQGQREIAHAEAQALADGHLSRRELRHLNTLLDQADAQIRLLRHRQG
jgi:hypothetical protein